MNKLCCCAESEVPDFTLNITCACCKSRVQRRKGQDEIDAAVQEIEEEEKTFCCCLRRKNHAKKRKDKTSHSHHGAET
jgi:hypothetical protein